MQGNPHNIQDAGNIATIVSQELTLFPIFNFKQYRVLSSNGYFCQISYTCKVRKACCVLLCECFSATYLTDFLYGFSAMTAPEVFCKFTPTTSATLIWHYRITSYHKENIVFSRMQIDAVDHHRICLGCTINTRYIIHMYVDTRFPIKKIKKKRVCSLWICPELLAFEFYFRDTLFVQLLYCTW